MYLMRGTCGLEVDMKDWQEIQDEIRKFSKETFGESDTWSKVSHLRKEIDEAAQAPDDIEEWADCMILLLDAIGSRGFTTDQLKQAVREKMAKNWERTWGEPDKDGVVEHVRDE
jgi:hypothetical protein